LVSVGGRGVEAATAVGAEKARHKLKRVQRVVTFIISPWEVRFGLGTGSEVLKRNFGRIARQTMTQVKFYA
jgi:hypothetical protein